MIWSIGSWPGEEVVGHGPADQGNLARSPDGLVVERLTRFHIPIPGNQVIGCYAVDGRGPVLVPVDHLGPAPDHGSGQFHAGDLPDHGLGVVFGDGRLGAPAKADSAGGGCPGNDDQQVGPQAVG